MTSQPIVASEGYHIDHFGNLVGVNYLDLREPEDRSPIALLIKGCRAEHAIEFGARVKITPPASFRDHGAGTGA